MYYVQDAHSFWDFTYFVSLIVVSISRRSVIYLKGKDRYSFGGKKMEDNPKAVCYANLCLFNLHILNVKVMIEIMYILYYSVLHTHTILRVSYDYDTCL